MPYRLRDGVDQVAIVVKRQDTASSSTPPTTSSAPTSTTTSSAPTSTTTSNPPTSTSTETSTSTAETSSTTEDATSSTAEESTAASSTTAASSITSAPASTTTAVTRTIIITSNGTVFTTAVTTPTTLPVTGSSKKSNTGAIVGGVVGGIALIGIVLVLFFWLRRRSKRHQFDDIFDPDHAAKPGRDHGAVDLDANPDAAPRPFEVDNTSGSGRPTSGTSSLPMPMFGGADMRQTSPPPDQRYYNQPSVQPGQIFSPNQIPYGTSPYATGGWVPTESNLSRGPSDPSSPSAYPISETGRSGSTNPTSAHSGLPYLAMPTAGAAYQQQSPNNTTQTTSSKTQEAQSSRLHVANDDVNSSGPVVQHADGGRLPAQEEQPTEVPPAYDTIPKDEPGSSNPNVSARARAEAAAPEKGPRPTIQ